MTSINSTNNSTNNSEDNKEYIENNIPKEIRFVEEICIVSKTKDKFYVNKNLLLKFSFFKKIFEDESYLKVIELNEDSKDLQIMLECLHDKKDSNNVKLITYFLVKWMHEGEFLDLIITPKDFIFDLIVELMKDNIFSVN